MGRAEAEMFAAIVARKEAENEQLRALLEKAYRFISPNYDPSGQSATQMAAEIRRALEQKGSTNAD